MKEKVLFPLLLLLAFKLLGWEEKEGCKL